MSNTIIYRTVYILLDLLKKRYGERYIKELLLLKKSSDMIDYQNQIVLAPTLELEISKAI